MGQEEGARGQWKMDQGCRQSDQAGVSRSTRVLLRGKPPVEAVILGPSFLSYPLRKRLTRPQHPTLARHSRPLHVQLPSWKACSPLADSYPPLRTASGRPPIPEEAAALLCSHGPACHFWTHCSGFSCHLTSVAPLDHEFRETEGLAPLGLVQGRRW